MPTLSRTTNTSPQTQIGLTPRVTADRRDPNRQPVYINTYGCVPGVTADVQAQNTPAYVNIIYYIKNGNLYKRTIANLSGSPATCGSDFLHQTCPADHVTPSCPADVVVAENVTAFNLAYLKAGYIYDGDHVAGSVCGPGSLQ
jgi:hypothetical protein